MTHTPTEDVPYSSVDDFALEDGAANENEDQVPETELIKDIDKYLKAQIKLHNSFDAILPEAELTMTTQQQVQMHKIVVIHLRQIKQIIKDKVEEK